MLIKKIKAKDNFNSQKELNQDDVLVVSDLLVTLRNIKWANNKIFDQFFEQKVQNSFDSIQPISSQLQFHVG